MVLSTHAHTMHTENTPQPMQLSKKYEGRHIRKAMGSNTKGLKIELEITLSVQTSAMSQTPVYQT